MSEDSFEKEVARVDKDISNGIYDKDLVLEDMIQSQIQAEEDEKEDKARGANSSKNMMTEDDDQEEQIKFESNISRALSE